VRGFAPGDALRRYLPYAVVLAVVLVIVLFGHKYWDANDDIHMSMVAGGYGLAAQPSPGVVYSNVIWGWLAMRLGAPFGVQGYTLIAYAAMLASAAAVAWALLRRRVPGILAATVLLAMFVHALLEPQFSVTAGFAAVAGLALACTLGSWREWPVALAAGLLLVVASLIRLQECMFVCVVAAPFVAWQLYRSFGTPAFRPLAAVLLAAAALSGGAKLVDNAYYTGPGWQQFRDMNALRRPFTDYALHGYFEHRPELLKPVGMTVNDMVMMGDWFFLDSKVYNDQSLGYLLQHLPLRERLKFNLQRIRSSTAPFNRPMVYFLALTALLGLVLARTRTVAIAAVLCLGLCMAAMLLLGRPGVPRIFPGPVAAIAVLALLDHGQGKRVRLLALIVGTGLLFWVSLNSYHFFRGHQRQARIGARVEHGTCAIATPDLAVVWGAPEGFPDRYLYDPAAPLGGRCPLHIYHVGVVELLPDNLQQLHAYTGGLDLVPALLAGQRIHFFTTDDRLDELAQYMREHYAAKLTYTALPSRPYLRQYLVQVETQH
jgi:hypothetical protein